MSTFMQYTRMVIRREQTNWWYRFGPLAYLALVGVGGVPVFVFSPDNSMFYLADVIVPLIAVSGMTLIRFRQYVVASKKANS